jgi:hypothetical protein
MIQSPSKPPGAQAWPGLEKPAEARLGQRSQSGIQEKRNRLNSPSSRPARFFLSMALQPAEQHDRQDDNDDEDYGPDADIHLRGSFLVPSFLV